MRSHTDATVTIQTSAESVLSPPSWFGEVVLLARYLRFICRSPASLHNVFPQRPRGRGEMALIARQHNAG